MLVLLLVQAPALMSPALPGTVSAGADAAVAATVRAGGPAAPLCCPGQLMMSAAALGAAVAAAGAASAAAAAPPAALRLLARRGGREPRRLAVTLEARRGDVARRAARQAVAGQAAFHAVMLEEALRRRAVPRRKMIADVSWAGRQAGAYEYGQALCAGQRRWLLLLLLWIDGLAWWRQWRHPLPHIPGVWLGGMMWLLLLLDLLLLHVAAAAAGHLLLLGGGNADMDLIFEGVVRGKRVQVWLCRYLVCYSVIVRLQGLRGHSVP
jgi:hypothetical protein